MRGNGDLPTNAYGERSISPVSVFDDGHLTAEERARTVEDLVRMAMIAAGVRMACVFVRVRVARHFKIAT